MRTRLGEASGGHGVARTADIDGVRDVLRLAVVEGLELGELNTVLLHQVGETEKHVAAVARVALLEGLEGLGRGGDGVIDVLLAGRLDGGDHLLGRRVDGVELHGAGGEWAGTHGASTAQVFTRRGGGAHLGAALRIDELVVDEQLGRQGERSDLDGHLDVRVVKAGEREV